MSGGSWGGSEELWAATARAAQDAGWDVSVSVCHATDPMHQVLRSRGIAVHKHFVPVGRRGRLQSLVGRVHSPLFRQAAMAPDALLVSQGTTYDLVDNRLIHRALTTGALANVPLVLVCQLNHDAPPPRMWRDRALSVFERAAAVLFVSDRNRRQAVRHVAADLPNARVVRNPVTLSSLDAVSLVHPGQTARFASVARLDVKYKGQDLLLEALAGPGWTTRDWHLSLYGTGEDADYLQKLVHHLGLVHRVTLRGHVNNVRNIWRDEEILILPSRDEGTPLALVEAMICGRPALVTRVAGNDEWIEAGRSGFIAEAASVESIADSLEQMWVARPDWPAMGAVARETALAQVDPAPGSTVLQLLEEIVSGTAPTEPRDPVS